MNSNAAELYRRIEANPEYTQVLFRQALQDPKGALESICELGNQLDLPVSVEEVKKYISTIEDLDTKQWLIKARGGM